MNKAEYKLLSGKAKILHSLFCQYPEPEFIEQFRHQEIIDLWPSYNKSSSAGVQLIMRALYNETRSDKESIELKLDYTRLFIGVGEPVCPPWGSIYLSPSQLVNDESTLELVNFYRSIGVNIEVGNNEPIDHIGLMMLVLSYLFEELASDKSNGEHFGSCIVFFRHHFCPWVGCFLKELEQHADTDFYKGLSLLAQSYVSEVKQLLGVIPEERKLYR